MHFYSTIPATAILIYVFIFSLVYNQHSKDKVTRSFLYLNSAILFWTVSDYLMFFFPFPEDIRITGIRLAAVFWMPIPLLSLLFIHRIIGKKLSRFWILYAAGVLVCIYVYCTGDLGVGAIKSYRWGTNTVPGPWYTFFVFTVPCVPTTYSAILLALALLRANRPDIKTIYIIIFIGGFVATFTNLMVNLVVPIFLGIEDLPRLGSSTLTIFSFSIYIAMTRYRFLTIAPEHVAEELFDDVPDGIILSDQIGHIQKLNRSAQKIFGSNDEHYTGTLLTDFLNEHDIIKEGNNEIMRENRSGENRIYLLSRSVPTRRHKNIGTIIIFREITDQKRIEGMLRKSRNELEKEIERRTNELYQAQKMEAIGTLAGGIAHDFNNMLAVILGFAGAAKDDLTDNKEVRSDLDEIVLAANQAKEIVQQILTFSRKNDCRPMEMEVTVLVEDALRLLHVSLPSTVHIRTQLGQGPNFVLGEPSQINQVLMNLCTNAYQSMQPDGGEISVSVNTIDINDNSVVDYENLNPGRYVQIEVSDTGGGIDPNEIDKVFEPFFTTKDTGSGTGLGLATAQRIIQAHQGTITVESVPQVGSTFCIYLPTIDSGTYDGPDDDDAKARELALVGGDEHILVVDDEAQVLRVTRRLLEPFGYNVTVLGNSFEAWLTFRDNPDNFDIVITDQTMASMTGAELSREILSIRPDIPIVLISGYTNAVTPTIAKEIGIRAFLAKPVTRSLLVRTIRDLLDGREIEMNS